MNIHMEWKIVLLHQFTAVRYQHGLAHLGFHDTFGNQYALSYDEHWIACLSANGDIKWSAGKQLVPQNRPHIYCELQLPTYVTDCGDGAILVTSSGNKRVYRIHPKAAHAELVIDGEKLQIQDLGNCEYDGHGDLWLNEVTGCKIWQFDALGKPKNVLGNGTPGFQTEETDFATVQFSWVYDLRRGPDGNIYVLDSRNYAVRLIDIYTKTIHRIAGTGIAGYSGDGGSALSATFGSDPQAHFDGPWSLAVDETGNIYIGDTQNHVVRLVDQATQQITTIAGKHPLDVCEPNNPVETNPMAINLPLICSLDYHAGKLYIPEWDGELLVLEKIGD